MNNQIEKLESVSLENVTGGEILLNPTSVRRASELAFGAGIIFGATTLAGQIQSMVYRSKANKALLNGDKPKYDYCSKAAQAGDKACIGLGAVALAAFTTSAIAYKINIPLRQADDREEIYTTNFNVLDRDYFFGGIL